MTATLQFYTLTAMIGMGVWLGASLDTYERFTVKQNRFRLLIAVRDLFFWILQALIVFYVLLKLNHGEIRIYIFLALLCGYAAYQALFKRLYQNLLEWTIKVMTALYRFCTSFIKVFLGTPLKWVLHILYRLSMIVITIVRTTLVFILRIAGAPFLWLANRTGLTTQLRKLLPFYNLIKDFCRRLLKKDREE
ncbi:spore cortex biosynthesis protein YabQ [Bacillus sp. FSL W7-1360]